MEDSVRTWIIIFSFAMIMVSFLIGLWAKKKADSVQSFFGATALFGPVTVGLSSTAAVASAFAVVGVPGLIYATGNAMSFWMLSSACFAISYFILGKKIRAMAEVAPIASLGDISDLRFNNNKAIKGIMSIILFIGCIAYLSSQIKAGSEFFGHLVGWSPVVAGFVIFGILTVYTALSGEVGGLLTQAFQGAVMAFAGIILIIGFFMVTGGMQGVLEVTASAGEISAGGVTKIFSPDIMNAWGVLPGTVAMAWMVIPILGLVGQPTVLCRMYAIKDPTEMPKLTLYATLSHMAVAVMAVLAGYGALYLVGKGLIAPLTSPDLAVFVFSDYLGIWAQLFVYAAVLAGAMSSASMFLSLSAGFISRDLPSAFGFKPSPEKQLTISRITIFALGILAVLFSLSSGEMVAILGTFGWGTLMSATFPVFIIGLLWKKASSEGVLSGLAVALVLNIVCMVLLRSGFKFWGSLPWYFNVITAAILTTVIVSLFTTGSTANELDERVEAVMDL